MKLPTCWATKTLILSSGLSTTGKELLPDNGGSFKKTHNRQHEPRVAQRDAQFFFNEGFTL